MALIPTQWALGTIAFQQRSIQQQCTSVWNTWLIKVSILLDDRSCVRDSPFGCNIDLSFIAFASSSTTLGKDVCTSCSQGDSVLERWHYAVVYTSTVYICRPRINTFIMTNEWMNAVVLGPMLLSCPAVACQLFLQFCHDQKMLRHIIMAKRCWDTMSILTGRLLPSKLTQACQWMIADCTLLTEDLVLKGLALAFPNSQIVSMHPYGTGEWMQQVPSVYSS